MGLLPELPEHVRSKAARYAAYAARAHGDLRSYLQQMGFAAITVEAPSYPAL